MKNIKISISILLLIFFYSCTDEKIDPIVKIPTDANNPTNVILDPNNPSNPIAGELFITNPSNDYFPMAVMNKWNYDTKTSTKELKILSDKTIEAVKYFKLNEPIIDTKSIGDFSNTDITCYVRKLSGDYYQRININRPENYTPPEGGNSGVSVKSGIVIQPFEVKFFKESVAVGQSFLETKTLDQLESKTVTIIENGLQVTRTRHVTSYPVLKYTVEVLEKKENQFVNKIRTTIIKTKLTNNLNSDVTFYWFAKNIGLIRQSNENDSSEVIDFLEIKTFSFF